jgi:hypothetical protein
MQMQRQVQMQMQGLVRTQVKGRHMQGQKDADARGWYRCKYTGADADAVHGPDAGAGPCQYRCIRKRDR